MPRSIARWLIPSHLIAALAALLMLPFLSLTVGVRVTHAAAPVQAVTCEAVSTTRPQPVLPKGFTEQILYKGCLNQPTAISFNSDKTRVFVAEKGGRVWNCEVASPTCTLFADLSSEVCNQDDRGLLGLAVDPLNDAKVYVLYTTPRAAGACSGYFPTAGQLSLVTAAGETKILPAAGATSQTWCFYSQSHSIGALVFGSDNKTLFVSAGDGSNFQQVDYGQLDNACGDGTNLPQGSFRSQGVSPYSDGVILRITNPGTGTQSVATIANGLRNPFRFARAPGSTDDLYIGNVGWNTWESIDHASIAGQNFGWPCYEGPNTQPDYQATNYCGSVGGVTAPFFAYGHQSYVSDEDRKGKTCGGRPSGGGPDQNGSVISAIGFTDGTSRTYPAPYDKALYFGDILRKCIWTMQPPDNTPRTFAKALEGGPVDLKTGPAGDLFYVDLITSTVRRISHK